MSSSLKKQLFASALLVSFCLQVHAEEVNHHFDMTEQSWNEDGDIEFDNTFLDNGADSWGNIQTTDFYMQTTSGSTATDIYLPSAQEVDTARAVKLEFDARYLTAGSHNYVSFGNDGDLDNAIWFGFNNQEFLLGTGTELAISGNQPNSSLVEFSTAQTLTNATRIGVRVGFDTANESMRNFQIDTDNDGNYETELLDSPVDLSAAGLAPEDWFFVSYFGGEGSRIDDIKLGQLDFYGDYNIDLDFDSEDMELICGGIRNTDLTFDFDQDGEINRTDLEAFARSNLSLLADLDFNGMVEFADFLTLSGAFGREDATYGDGDVSCNGAVGFEDFLILSANFNRLARRGPTTAAVPEPTGSLPMVLALLGFMHVRRSRTNR